MSLENGHGPIIHCATIYICVTRVLSFAKYIYIYIYIYNMYIYINIYIYIYKNNDVVSSNLVRKSAR